MSGDVSTLADRNVITIQRMPYNPIVSIDKVLGDVIYIRTSERLLFRRCRRLWGWNSPLKMNLEAVSKPDYFWFGTGMHYALEDFHGINQYGHAARAFEAFCVATLDTKEAPEHWKEYMVLGIEMMSYYVDYWLNARNREYQHTYIHEGVYQTEVRFEIDLPIKGPQGQVVKYRGQLDRMVQDENGDLWVGEYKSAKVFRMQHFDVDDQISAYCWAAQAIYGKPVQGVIYQQHKKDVPHPPKILSTGKVSTNKTMNTSYALYRKVLMDVYGDPSRFPGDNIRYLNTLVTDEEDDADKFIRRDKIYRNQYQIAAQGEKILLEVEDMLREGLPLYPNPSKDCSWLCPLESVCIAMDDGSDFESLLEALTTNREEISDKWRLHLPPPSQLQEAPLRAELQGITLQELLEAPEPKVELLQLLELDW